MCDAPSRISAFNRSADKSTDNNGGQHAEVQDLATNVQIRRGEYNIRSLHTGKPRLG